MKPQLSPNEWSRRMAWSLDFLSLGALAATFEVKSSILAIVGIALIASRVFHRILKRSFSDKVILGLFVSVIIGATLQAFRGRAHPIETAAQTAPLAHALIWFAADTVRNRGWRLGLGFVELVLASALTTDLYLPAAIFLFVILSSVGISCSFLANQLKLRASERVEEALPSSFIRDSFGVSLLIFLTSAIIFPILPRRSVDMPSSLGFSRVDYTEEVNLADASRGMDDSTGRPLLRLYPPANIDLSTELYLGLVRGAVLDRFDGTTWRTNKRRTLVQVEPRALPQSDEHLWISAVREPLGTEILPTPYGSSSVAPSSGDTQTLQYRLSSGEWFMHRSSRQRAAYRLALSRSFKIAQQYNDPPQEMHRMIPPGTFPDRVVTLANRIFGAKPQSRGNERNKIVALRNFFAESGFESSYSGDPGAEQQNTTRKEAPLERFLFVTRSGHCEHFASAGALLLRHAGVATRLVSGFRLSRSAPPGAPLTLRSSDAHAWLEAWIPGQGWLPVDLTPRTPRPSTWSAWALDAYDQLSAYWYRYIVTYDEQSQMDLGGETVRRWKEGSGNNLSQWGTEIRRVLRDRLDLIALGVLALVGATGLFYWISRTFSRSRWLSWNRWRTLDRQRRPWIQARLRMEKWLARKLRTGSLTRPSFDEDLRNALSAAREHWDARKVAELERWIDGYQKGRFGEESSGAALAALKEIERGLRGDDSAAPGRTSGSVP